MKAVVTGGAGFIGSHLVDLLVSKDLEVVVIDNLSTGRIENLSTSKSRCKFIEADLSELNTSWTSHLKDAQYVFHLASLADIVPSIEKPLDYYHSNVTSTINLLSNISANQIKKFVYAASSSCYGLASQFPTPETAMVDPQYPYALTKYLGEEVTMHWAKVYGIPSISTRFFNVYGTRSRTSGTYGAVFGVFLAQKLANKPLTIVGDGNQTRDFTYVTDVAQGLLDAALSSFTSEVFNLGSGRPQSINRLAELIGGERIYIPKRPGEPDRTHADISKAKALLGYNPKIDFEQGVRIVLDNINYWSNAPVWTPSTISKATKPWFDFLG